MFDDLFDSAYRRLVSAFGRYHDTPRGPDTVPMLGEARWQLHLARRAMAQQRSRVMDSEGPAEPPPRVAVTSTDLARLRVNGIGNEF